MTTIIGATMTILVIAVISLRRKTTARKLMPIAEPTLET
jgi:hypothetical protein